MKNDAQNKIVNEFLNNIDNKIEKPNADLSQKIKLQMSYVELNRLKTSISKICLNALISVTDTDATTTEIEEVNYSVMDLLKFSSSLDLHSESEFLDKLQNNSKKNSNSDNKLEHLVWFNDKNSVDPSKTKEAPTTLDKYLELNAK